MATCRIYDVECNLWHHKCADYESCRYGHMVENWNTSPLGPKDPEARDAADKRGQRIREERAAKWAELEGTQTGRSGRKAAKEAADKAREQQSETASLRGRGRTETTGGASLSGHSGTRKAVRAASSGGCLMTVLALTLLLTLVVLLV